MIQLETAFLVLLLSSVVSAKTVVHPIRRLTENEINRINYISLVSDSLAKHNGIVPRLSDIQINQSNQTAHKNTSLFSSPFPTVECTTPDDPSLYVELRNFSRGWLVQQNAAKKLSQNNHSIVPVSKSATLEALGFSGSIEISTKGKGQGQGEGPLIFTIVGADSKTKSSILEFLKNEQERESQCARTTVGNVFSKDVALKDLKLIAFSYGHLPEIRVEISIDPNKRETHWRSALNGYCQDDLDTGTNFELPKSPIAYQELVTILEQATSKGAIQDEVKSEREADFFTELSFTNRREKFGISGQKNDGVSQIDGIDRLKRLAEPLFLDSLKAYYRTNPNRHPGESSCKNSQASAN